MAKPVLWSVDDRARPIVRVPLTSPAGLYVTLDAADYDQWVAEGRSLRWRLNDNGAGTFLRVVCSGPAGCRVSVGRLLANARPDQRVGWSDRDPLNLRRTNLRVTPIPRHAPQKEAAIAR
jgi:hypothetical protein